MRGKRSKQYRKLMQQYALTFNFREPYQVLVDAQMIQDTHRFSMDLAPALTRTLHGAVKPMITQCSIRHLFALPTRNAADTTPAATDSITQAEKTALLTISRSCTLRRCNHHTLADPLSTLDCYRDVVDSSDQGTNKHRYILAAQDEDVRDWARGVQGVPMIYVKRSVMVMEPMAQASVGAREREEKGKLRSGVKRVAGQGDVLGKRKRDDTGGAEAGDNAQDEEEIPKKKKKAYGVKGPNPLSVKKKKKAKSKSTENGENIPQHKSRQAVKPEAAEPGTDDPKKKRRRKHKASSAIEPVVANTEQPESVALETG